MVAYARIEDLRTHWPDLPVEREAEAAQKLREAEIEIRALFPDVDSRIDALTLDFQVPQLVVCRMVRRAMDVSADVPTAGLESFQIGTGPFTMGGKIHNPDGNLYLTAADKRLLSNPRQPRRGWTIRMGDQHG